jgi:hypothetical protein
VNCPATFQLPPIRKCSSSAPFLVLLLLLLLQVLFAALPAADAGSSCGSWKALCMAELAAGGHQAAAGSRLDCPSAELASSNLHANGFVNKKVGMGALCILECICRSSTA